MAQEFADSFLLTFQINILKMQVWIASLNVSRGLDIVMQLIFLQCTNFAAREGQKIGQLIYDYFG